MDDIEMCLEGDSDTSSEYSDSVSSSEMELDSCTEYSGGSLGSIDLGANWNLYFSYYFDDWDTEQESDEPFIGTEVAVSSYHANAAVEDMRDASPGPGNRPGKNRETQLFGTSTPEAKVEDWWERNDTIADEAISLEEYDYDDYVSRSYGSMKKRTSEFSTAENDHYEDGQLLDLTSKQEMARFSLDVLEETGKGNPLGRNTQPEETNSGDETGTAMEIDYD
jgi:hypothetical protein